VTDAAPQCDGWAALNGQIGALRDTVELMHVKVRKMGAS
jgi:hypothetical protein